MTAFTVPKASEVSKRWHEEHPNLSPGLRHAVVQRAYEEIRHFLHEGKAISTINVGQVLDGALRAIQEQQP